MWEERGGICCLKEAAPENTWKTLPGTQSSAFPCGILKTLSVEITEGMKENPMGVSWAPDVPHINWDTVNVFQLLCWVQDLTWTESGEGHQEGSGVSGAQVLS